jgi:general nucleoside transport system permease protein
MIPAILKTRFNTNEILVSLLLVYVAEKLLAAAAGAGCATPRARAFPARATCAVSGGREPRN